MTTQKIIIAGSGGQGIMLSGKILAQAAMQEDKFVTWLPAYGAEVRGGASYCMVIISDHDIGSPCIQLADIVIAMNGPSADKFKIKVKDGGLLIMNSSLSDTKSPKDITCLKHPFTDIAIKLGNIKVANMVALGVLAANKKTVGLKSILRVVSEIAPQAKKELIEVNCRALAEGARLGGIYDD
jgi:2-oxoglutarate ferredoxin oxidoreductase subunit gamma